MKYEEGKTYTLTGDETHYEGGTLRDYYTYISTNFDFPVEAVFEKTDFEGDLQFTVAEGWTIYVKGDSKFDVVAKPEHYNTNLPEGVEVIDIIEAQTAGLSGIRAVCQANLLKYALRWQKKNGVEDLRKMVFYANRLIGELE